MVTPGMRLRIPPMPSSPFIQPLSPSFAATTTARRLRVDGDKMLPERAPRPLMGGACARRRLGDAAAHPADDDMGPGSPPRRYLPRETYREPRPGLAGSCEERGAHPTWRLSRDSADGIKFAHGSSENQCSPDITLVNARVGPWA